MSVYRVWYTFDIYDCAHLEITFSNDGLTDQWVKYLLLLGEILRIKCNWASVAALNGIDLLSFLYIHVIIHIQHFPHCGFIDYFQSLSPKWLFMTVHERSDTDFNRTHPFQNNCDVLLWHLITANSVYWGNSIHALRQSNALFESRNVIVSLWRVSVAVACGYRGHPGYCFETMG